MIDPLWLAANRPRSFYRDSGAIDAFRGTPPDPGDPYHPEDWLASATGQHGRGATGMSVLPDGRLLKDALDQDPEAWLGPAHVAAYGGNPMVLVKLLDAGQRLPVHVHPDRSFAAEHLASASGKTEAWVILAADDGAVVHVGFSADVSSEQMLEWCREQDVAALLAHLNTIPVVPGDTVFVPAGTPHAIGAGVLLAEVQEPTDFSIFLEWEGFDVGDPLRGQLGLPWELAASAAAGTRTHRDRLARLRAEHDGLAFPSEADDFFRVRRLTATPDSSVRLPAGYGVLLVVAGEGSLRWGAGGTSSSGLRRGETVLVPYDAGPVEVSGTVSALLAQPPRPHPPGAAAPATDQSTPRRTGRTS